MEKKIVVKKLAKWLEERENSPFKNAEKNIKVKDFRASKAYLSTVEIFYEKRSVSKNHEPTTSLGVSPTINENNIEPWTYSISPSYQFNTHSNSIRITDSEYVETCHGCNGSGENTCYTCSGSGDCDRCYGKGQVHCPSKCANGRCTKCAGSGEVRCGSQFMLTTECNNGRCTSCKGAGYDNNSRCASCGGSGAHRNCRGTGKEKCNSCSGSGACNTCNGRGSIDCYNCHATGHCQSCRGSGKITCSTCDGKGRLMHYLSVTADFINEFTDKQVKDDWIKTYNPVDLNDLTKSTGVNKIHNKESNHFENAQGANTELITHQASRDFVEKQIKNNSHSNIHKERVYYYEIPVYTLNYEFEGGTYESYFFTDDLIHHFKTNPFEEYLRIQEELISNLIQDEKYGSAYQNITQLIKSYESIENEEKVKEYNDSLSSTRLKIQQDIGKGGFWAQVLISLFNLIMILSCSSEGLGQNQLLLFLGIELFRHSYYAKQTVYWLYFKDISKPEKRDEVNKYINGDSMYNYYYYGGVAPGFGMFIGLVGIGYSIYSMNWPMFGWILIISGLISIFFNAGIAVNVRKTNELTEKNRLDKKLSRFMIILSWDLLIYSALIIGATLLFEEVFNLKFKYSNFELLMTGGISLLIISIISIIIPRIKGSQEKISNSERKSKKKTLSSVDEAIKNKEENQSKSIKKKKSKNIVWMLIIALVIAIAIPSVYYLTGTKDYDGNLYGTVKINNTKWLKENLKTTHFRDGSAIRFASNIQEWNDAKDREEPAYSYFDFDENNANEGLIYNGYAVVDRRGLAPKGFHVTTKSDWQEIKEHFTSGNTQFDYLSETKLANSENEIYKYWTANEFGDYTLVAFCNENLKILETYFDKFNKGEGYIVRCVEGEIDSNGNETILDNEQTLIQFEDIDKVIEKEYSSSRKSYLKDVTYVIKASNFKANNPYSWGSLADKCYELISKSGDKYRFISIYFVDGNVKLLNNNGKINSSLDNHIIAKSLISGGDINSSNFLHAGNSQDFSMKYDRTSMNQYYNTYRYLSKEIFEQISNSMKYVEITKPYSDDLLVYKGKTDAQQMINQNRNENQEIRIGNLIWNSKNLDVSTFNNGDEILFVTNESDWIDANENKIPAYCYYEFNESYGANYGKLYNWYAINDSRGIAPDGWRIPNKTELDSFIELLGNPKYAGNKLKEVGLEHWDSNNESNDSTGFSALPGGYCTDGGYFNSIGRNAIFWMSDNPEEKRAYGYKIGQINWPVENQPNAFSIEHGAFAMQWFDKGYGLSIRCVKDDYGNDYDFEFNNDNDYNNKLTLLKLLENRFFDYDQGKYKTLNFKLADIKEFEVRNVKNENRYPVIQRSKYYYDEETEEKPEYTTEFLRKSQNKPPRLIRRLSNNNAISAEFSDSTKLFKILQSTLIEENSNEKIKLTNPRGGYVIHVILNSNSVSAVNSSIRLESTTDPNIFVYWPDHVGNQKIVKLNDIQDLIDYFNE